MSIAALHRALAWSLLTLVLAAAWVAIVSPLRAYVSAAGETLRQDRELLDRVRILARQTEQARDLESQASAVESSVVFLPGATDAIKAANLQSLISELAERSGARLRSARALQAKELETARLIGVQVQLTCDTERLQRLLLALEESVPLLIVEQVQVANSPVRGSPGRAGVLEVRLDVYGGTQQGRKS